MNNTIIKKLQSIDPSLRLKTTAEFYNDPTSTGIWFIDSEGGEFDGEPIIGRWEVNEAGTDAWFDSASISEKLEKVLKDNGWCVEFYDSRTLTAFYQG